MIKKEESVLKMLFPHICAVVFFLAITMIYFSPLIEGKVLPQHDVTQFEGAAQELRDYYEKDGESSAWTGSMFSGMPSYQIGIWGGAPNFLNYLEAPLKALGGSTAGPVFTAMLMAYILFCVMGFKPITAILGAVAYSLSSYNIIILDAGHVTKAWTLAYMPLIVAGVMVLFKRKLLLGGLFMALGLALQIKSNHLQSTYYTGLFCVILYIAFIIKSVSEKEIKMLLKASGIMVVAVAIAVLCNMGNIYANMEMARESTRGQSELTASKSETEKQSDGLDIKYAFDWSYGKAETFTVMVPNLYGGFSKPYDDNANSVKALYQRAQRGEVPTEFADQVSGIIPQYWGAQPSTQGPVYFGIIVCFLFILGMIIIRSKIKWALLVATVFFLFLSWGKNLEWFNEWFFYHFPLYSKFRAPSMALVVPALSVVMVAVWGVKEFFSGELDKKKITNALYISLGITAFICLVLWLAPGTFFNFTSESDAMWRSQIPDWYYNALMQDRKDLLSSDALRSLVFVLLAGAVMIASLRVKLTTQKMILNPFIAAIVLLVLIDLWGVDRRYMNDSKFVSKSAYKTETFQKTTADNAILQDTHPSYRVLNLNGNAFQETSTSYYHKSIGGYHAAKLKRYQELVESRLGGEASHVQKNVDAYFRQILQAESQQTSSMEMLKANMANKAQLIQDSIVTPLMADMTVLNMLNTKYFIFNFQVAPKEPPFVSYALTNPHAMGNAWFVDEYKLVDNADQEIEAINTLDPLRTALVDKRFEKELSGLSIVPDSTATIELTEYKPNKLTYKSKAGSEQLAVLSEIYFSNGWQAYVDGKEVPHFRADWTLRAMRIPAGEHEIVFTFEPQGYSTSRMVATASSALLVLLLIGMVVMPFVRKKKE